MLEPIPRQFPIRLGGFLPAKQAPDNVENDAVLATLESVTNPSPEGQPLASDRSPAMKSLFLSRLVFAVAGVLSLAVADSASAQQRRFLGAGSGGRGAFSWTQRIDFEQAPAGSMISSASSNGGFGPVLIRAINPLLPGQNAAVLFNSSSPTGGDDDLGTPNEDFGGPGIGAGGGLGSQFPNRIALGNVLIVASDLVDANGDQLVDDPDDAENPGTLIELDLAPGDAFLEADFCFVDPPARLGDTVFCDLDNDGVQDPNEPGVPDITIELLCAGPDQILGTADDIGDQMVTDASGG